MADNLFSGMPTGRLAEEEFRRLLARPGLVIERIVSTGQVSPPDFWYDQEDGEWVLLVAGEAWLRFEDEAEPRRLKAGDFVDIAPHRRHRVEWTHPEEATVWLAVHYGDAPSLSQEA